MSASLSGGAQPQQQVQVYPQMSTPLESNYGSNYPDKSQTLNGNEMRAQGNLRQNEYIEVVNLPSGGQSVEYTPRLTSFEEPASGENLSGNHGQSQESPATAPLSLQNSNQGGHHSQTHKKEYETDAVIEYLDGASIQPVFNAKKETNVVTLNNHKQTVSSLDPKTLVEMIAKQVPSLRDVLTSKAKDSYENSYEIIEMPPKYHNVDDSGKRSQGSNQASQPNYSSSEEQADYTASSDTKEYVEGHASSSDHGSEEVSKNNNDYLEETSRSQDLEKGSTGNQEHRGDHHGDHHGDHQENKSNQPSLNLPSGNYDQRLQTAETQESHPVFETETLPVSRLKVQSLNGLLIEPAKQTEVTTD